MFNPLSDDEPDVLKFKNCKLGNYSPIIIKDGYLYTIGDKKTKEGAWDRFFVLCAKL